MTKTIPTIGVVLLASGLAMPAAAQDTRTYQVTIENLTTGQPISPGVAVTHDKRASLFQNGMPVSGGIIAIAEDGNPAVAAGVLEGLADEGDQGVYDVVTFFGDDAPPLFPIGGAGATTSTFTIEAPAGATHLSFAAMLICTNDGFTGVDSLWLPYTSVTKYAKAYDAGSEVNDGKSSSIVDPCSAVGPVALAGDDNGNNNALPEDGGRVTAHKALTRKGDLLKAHRWQGPVSKITVTLLPPAWNDFRE